MKRFLKTKRSGVWAVLVTASVVALLISNTIAGKMLSLAWLGPIGSMAKNITVAAIVFPISYILSSVFSEVYGYEDSRFTCYLSFAFNLVMVIFYEIAIALPGEGPTYQDLHNGLGVLVASLTAYVIGDFFRDKIFAKMKDNANKGGFVVRSVASAFVGELVDSAIFATLLQLLVIGIATFSIKSIAVSSVIYAILKAGYELIVSPFTVALIKKIEILEQAASE